MTVRQKSTIFLRVSTRSKCQQFITWRWICPQADCVTILFPQSVDCVIRHFKLLPYRNKLVSKDARYRRRNKLTDRLALTLSAQISTAKP